MTEDKTLDPREIERLERRATTAWPPAESIELNGWRLDFDRGVTRRANSVLPNQLEEGADPEALIDQVERLYHGRGLAPCFKISPACQPADLDARLAARGYRAEGHSLVLKADLAGLPADPTASPGLEIRLQSAPDALWFQACWPEDTLEAGEAKRRIASRTQAPRCFALALCDGRAAGAAAAAIDNGWTCINAVQIHTDFRRRGFARALMVALTAWAGAQDARHLYLQVEQDNGPARQLYAGLGFGLSYPYHYRRA